MTCVRLASSYASRVASAWPFLIGVRSVASKTATTNELNVMSVYMAVDAVCESSPRKCP